MAESLSHRLNEYLKSGPNAEGINTVNYASSLEVKQEASMINLDSVGQRDKNQDRRSSITSFADLYERAVRNVLSIRPLFDSTLEMFTQRPEDGILYPVDTQNQAHRTGNATENTQFQDIDEAERSDLQSKAQMSKDSQAASINFRSNMADHSVNRFFTQILTEHVRHGQQRHFSNSTNRTNLYSGHSVDTGPRYSSISAKNQENRGRNSFVKCQSQDDHGDKDKRQFLKYSEKNSKYKPGMLDSLKHTSRLFENAGGKLVKLHDNMRNNFNKNDMEYNDVNDTTEVKRENTISKITNTIEVKTLETKYRNEIKSDLELLKEKIKENARLKYRPYSLRSKKGGLRKTFAGNKRKKNKMKKKKINIISNLSDPQDVFLLNLGLIRKEESDPIKRESKSDSWKVAEK